MKLNSIVTLADSKYFELLMELIESIKRFRESKDTAICVLDAGLSEEQKNKLLSKVDEINGLVVNVGPYDANLKVIDMASMVQEEFEDCKLEIGDGAGKDNRDYSVDFSLFSKIFPNFKFEYKKIYVR